MILGGLWSELRTQAHVSTVMVMSDAAAGATDRLWLTFTRREKER